MSERTTAPLRVQRPAWIDEFRAFIMRGNVIDLAVGIIIGVAFTGVVNSLVKDIFTPIIGLAVGGIDFTNLFVTLKGPSEPTLADAQKAGAVTLNTSASSSMP
jgi:large conductance mechanosensitive channel